MLKRKSEPGESINVDALPVVDAEDRTWRKVSKFDRMGPVWTMPIPRICRTAGAAHSAYLVLSPDMVGTARRADFYEDGLGTLAIDLHDTGEYLIGAQSKQRRLRLPAAYAARVPMGNTPITLKRDARGMLILDLNALPPVEDQE